MQSTNPIFPSSHSFVYLPFTVAQHPVIDFELPGARADKFNDNEHTMSLLTCPWPPRDGLSFSAWIWAIPSSRSKFYSYLWDSDMSRDRRSYSMVDLEAPVIPLITLVHLGGEVRESHWDAWICDGIVHVRTEGNSYVKLF